MRQSRLFTKTRREAPKDEVSKNAQLLIRAGYIHKEMAGVYSLLPLGLRVFEKIEQIIRDEMNDIGGQEVSLSSLQEPSLWSKTGRWEDDRIDVWFKTNLKNGSELGLACTHEEPMANMLTNFVSSYRELPIYPYQFQTKFRNELRSKSGLMRGREFVMKDLYSFNRTEEGMEEFYETVRVAYENIFKRIGIGNETYFTFASGGMFTEWSHEFQTVSEAGEDTIYIDTDKRIAVNKEVYTDDVLQTLKLDKSTMIEAKSIEVGNIFKYGTEYTEAIGLNYKNEDGTTMPIYMGAYGIGLGRLMGTVVELFSDDKGIVWPESIAPFTYHLVELSQGDEEIRNKADALYESFVSRGISVLYDDRDVRAGEKFADSDLLGIPYRVVVGKKSTPEALEVVRRATGETLTMTEDELLNG